MDINPVIVNNGFTRKRQRDPEKWKVNIAKRKRYASKSLPSRICEHDTKSFQCSKLTMSDLLFLHQTFYAHKTKRGQDTLLLKYCSIKPVQQRKNTKGKKQTTIKYGVYIKKQRVPICQKFFLHIFNITKHRIAYVMKRFHYTGDILFENRGGDRKSRKFFHLKQSIHQFIGTLKCTESHYCRKSKHAERKYLPAELNIKKLFDMYKSSEFSHMEVKQSYFRYVFNHYYNIGFGSPRTDVCSRCLELTEKLKVCTDPREKSSLIVEKTVHKRRANAFFEKLREVTPGLKVISFDCQKNLPLPKLPDQICYYSRQLYFYNLTMVEGSSNQPMCKDRVFAYCCTEDEFHKDSNLIASAVFHRLTQTDKTDITKIRLVADGCGGQNKNSIVIGTCCKWLLDNISIKSIEIVFPVTGHSYMPPDRQFGIIEKKLKKMEVILHPDEIIDIISQTSTLANFGTDCIVSDWRAATRNIMAQTTSWKVKFKECKRFILVRSKKAGNVLVRGEMFYKSDIGKGFNVCQRQKTISMIDAKPLPKIVAVNKKKLIDVKKLLNNHFGDEWANLPTLKIYKDLFNAQETLQFNPNFEADYCQEPLDDVNDLRV